MVRRAHAGLFRTRHRMAADKHILVTQTFHRLMDVCLRASDISDQRTRFQKRAYLFGIPRCILQGCRENNVTCGECLIDPVRIISMVPSAFACSSFERVACTP